MNMRYLKTFESFGSSGISGFEDMISVELSKLPVDQQEKLKSEVQNLANKLGVSVEELANPDFAVKLMTDKTEESNLENIVEEGVFGDVWDYVKSKSSFILKALGKIISWGGAIASAATAITGIVTASAEREAFTLYLRELTNIGELDRGVQATLCIAGLVGFIVAVVAGGMIQSKGEDMERSKKFGTGF
jgi:hypothetical protein